MLVFLMCLMRNRLHRGGGVCIGMLFCLSAFAELVVFERPLIQGGLVTGTTQASTMRLLGREVYLDTKGQFVFGLGRDVESPLKVELVDGLGERHSLSFEVQQREYSTQSIQGVEKKYVSPPESVSVRIAKDGQLVRQARQRFGEVPYYKQGFIWPAEGPVSGVYGSQRIFNGVPKRPHYGLDIAGPVGTPVYAPAPGAVSLVHDDLYYSGGTLIIDHGHGISSTFIHLSEIYVAQGELVKQGQKIAGMGKSGRVTGPHLDWRVNWFDQRLDPAFLLPERKSVELESETQ